jgi:hypothetical protein
MERAAHIGCPVVEIAIPCPGWVGWVVVSASRCALPGWGVPCSRVHRATPRGFRPSIADQPASVARLFPLTALGRVVPPLHSEDGVAFPRLNEPRSRNSRTATYASSPRARPPGALRKRSWPLPRIAGHMSYRGDPFQPQPPDPHITHSTTTNRVLSPCWSGRAAVPPRKDCASL